MIPRVTFILIAAFWVAMNVLLVARGIWFARQWRSRAGGSGLPENFDRAGRFIIERLSGRRTNRLCEFSTSVEQEMAELDDDKPPPAGLVARAGYQIRLNGNVASAISPTE